VFCSWSISSRRTVLAGAAFAFFAVVSPLCNLPRANAQTLPSIDGTLRITGKVEHPLDIHEADLHTFPHVSLEVTTEKGVSARYEGVPVVELLRRAGVPFGKELKGLRVRLYVIVEAADGYQAVFALPEFDPDFTDRIIILADRRDGRAFAPPEGPLRLVVSGEKRHARWVREVIAFDVEEAR
jgi:DMSO/TMAO reductase YedYZ molybdopterin-dependent catalytic subunit